MKTKLILGSFLALSIALDAQNTFPTTGNVGIGTTSPAYRLDVSTANQFDGVRISNSLATGNTGLFLRNSATAKEWQLWSLGSTNAWGGGNFCIYDGVSSVPQIFIKNSNGNVGIGTNNPGLARLFASQDVIPTGSSNTYYGMKSAVNIVAATPGAVDNVIGLEAIATGYNNTPAGGFPIGVYGEGKNGTSNVGGFFKASGGSSSSVNHGIKAISISSGVQENYGIWAEASNATASNWAGWFQGNTYCTGTYFGSDRKLKNNIEPLSQALDKIMLLKPRTYVFKTEDFKNMNLPKGKQIGLIAQELENVFPELVMDMSETKETNEKGDVIIKHPSFKAVQYVSLIPVLIAGIQEQESKIEAQQKQIDDQKQLINQLLQKSATQTGLDQNSMGAAGFKMEQNEPNPFNGVTTVKYTLPGSVTNAYMAVYDLSGKQIASFPITEKGSSAITITAEKLAAGIYIYSIVADNKIVDSKRMIVAEK